MHTLISTWVQLKAIEYRHGSVITPHWELCGNTYPCTNPSELISPKCRIYVQVNWNFTVNGMPCRLFGANPSPDPMLPYCQSNSWEQISVRFKSKSNLFIQKFIWKCRLPKWRPFCPGEMSQPMLSKVGSSGRLSRRLCNNYSQNGHPVVRFRPGINIHGLVSCLILYTFTFYDVHFTVFM